MIENQLYQIFHGLVTQAINESINRDLVPLILENISKHNRLLTYAEAMSKLNVSKPIFFRLLREKQLKTVVVAKRTFRIDLDDLKKFIESRKR